MQAYQVGQWGDQPAFAEIDTPVPGPGEVVIETAACGLNYADLLMIDGRYQVKPPLPVTLGMEVAGTVVAVGPGVHAFAVGDRVAAAVAHGGLAAQTKAQAARCVRLPDPIDFETAAAFPIAYGTSHLALTGVAALQPGETLTVLGAAGGVGLTAVEIGARLGARVIAVARGARKRAVAQNAGAVETLDSDDRDLRGAIKALGGSDVVYDAVGGELFDGALRSCRPGARYLVIGFAGGAVPQIPANYVLVKNIAVHGFWWGGQFDLDPARVTRSLAVLLDWLAAGRIAPYVGARVPFAEADRGLALLRDRSVPGKIVVTL